MKLLSIIGYYKPAYVYGGPVGSSAALYEGLSKLGVDVTVITTNANRGKMLDLPLLTPVDVDGVKVIYCPTTPFPGTEFHSPTQIAEAKKLIPDADVVNLQTFWAPATLPLGQFCITQQIPYFVTLHGQIMDYGMRQSSWTKRLKKFVFMQLVGNQYLNGAAALHSTSHLETEQLQKYPIHSPTFLVPNSIDNKFFGDLPKRGALREKFNIPGDALVMVMIGRIQAVKNPQFSVAALIAAQKLNEDVYLLIVGPDEDSMQSKLQAQVRDAGCGDKLIFTGFLRGEALLQAMVDSDLLVMPSKSENFAMASAEAMAVGLPVLISTKVPVGEYAREASAGKISDVDQDSFIRIAIDMLSRPADLKVMGNNGKAAAMKLFHQDVVAKDMLKNLEKIIANEKIS